MIDDKLAIPLGIAFIFFAIGLLAGWGAYANWKKTAWWFTNMDRHLTTGKASRYGIGKIWFR
jgi:hypothetical protein